MQRGRAGCLGREGTQVARAEWLSQGVKEVAGRNSMSAEGWWGAARLLGLGPPCSLFMGGPGRGPQKHRLSMSVESAAVRPGLGQDGAAGWSARCPSLSGPSLPQSTSSGELAWPVVQGSHSLGRGRDLGSGVGGACLQLQGCRTPLGRWGGAGGPTVGSGCICPSGWQTRGRR